MVLNRESERRNEMCLKGSFLSQIIMEGETLRNVSDESSHHAHFLSAHQIKIHLIQGVKPLKDTREQIKIQVKVGRGCSGHN